jgi:hypothetical protein
MLLFVDSWRGSVAVEPWGDKGCLISTFLIIANSAENFPGGKGLHCVQQSLQSASMTRAVYPRRCMSSGRLALPKLLLLSGMMSQSFSLGREFALGQR